MVGVTKIKLFVLALLVVVGIVAGAYTFDLGTPSVLSLNTQTHQAKEPDVREIAGTQGAPTRLSNARDQKEDSHTGKLSEFESPTPAPSKHSLSINERKAIKEAKAKKILAKNSRLSRELHKQFSLPNYSQLLNQRQSENSEAHSLSVEKMYASFLNTRIKDNDLLAIAHRLRLNSKMSLAFANRLKSFQHDDRRQLNRSSQSKTPLAGPTTNTRAPADIRSRLAREIAQALTALVSAPK